MTFLSAWWVFFCALAFFTAIANLVRNIKGNHNGWEFLMFVSLSSGLLAMLSQYHMTGKWALAGDWSAIQDVVPSMGSMLTWIVIAGIFLNSVVIYLNKN